MDQGFKATKYDFDKEHLLNKPERITKEMDNWQGITESKEWAAEKNYIGQIHIPVNLGNGNDDEEYEKRKKRKKKKNNDLSR